MWCRGTGRFMKTPLVTWTERRPILFELVRSSLKQHCHNTANASTFKYVFLAGARDWNILKILLDQRVGYSNVLKTETSSRQPLFASGAKGSVKSLIFRRCRRNPGAHIISFSSCSAVSFFSLFLFCRSFFPSPRQRYILQPGPRRHTTSTHNMRIKETTNYKKRTLDAHAPKIL